MIVKDSIRSLSSVYGLTDGSQSPSISVTTQQEHRQHDVIGRLITRAQRSVAASPHLMHTECRMRSLYRLIHNYRALYIYWAVKRADSPVALSHTHANGSQITTISVVLSRTQAERAQIQIRYHADRKRQSIPCPRDIDIWG
jgi:hypothetical protein